mgnify:CR=1 FL=1
MGYPVKYYDIAVHTVPEVFYDGRWHHYDNSLSVYYTLCDGKTVAGIEDVGKTLACEASDGKEEKGHIGIYHAVHGTGPDGFLEGADTIRDLRHLGHRRDAGVDAGLPLADGDLVLAEGERLGEGRARPDGRTPRQGRANRNPRRGPLVPRC